MPNGSRVWGTRVVLQLKRYRFGPLLGGAQREIFPLNLCQWFFIKALWSIYQPDSISTGPRSLQLVSAGMWWHVMGKNGSLSFSKCPELEPEPGAGAFRTYYWALIANILLSADDIRRSERIEKEPMTLRECNLMDLNSKIADKDFGQIINIFFEL